MNTSDQKNIYCCTAFLGKGAYGRVYLVNKEPNDESNKQFVLKRLSKSKMALKTEREARVLSELKILIALRKGLYFTKLYEAFESSCFWNFIMEYASGGDLFTYFIVDKKTLSERRLKICAAEISYGLNYLHKKNILYMDLKLENILISHLGHILISDFGLSVIVDESKTTNSAAGTTTYMAPETLTGGFTSFAADYWAFGIILHLMAAKRHPYKSIVKEKNYKFLLTQSKAEISSRLSSNFTDLIKRFLVLNSNKRLGNNPSEVDKIEKHPYFSSINWNDIFTRSCSPPFHISDKKDLEYLPKTQNVEANVQTSEKPLSKRFKFSCFD